MTRTSAFTMAFCLIAILALGTVSAVAQQPIQALSNAVAHEPLQADTSAPLRSMPVTPPSRATLHRPLSPKPRAEASPQLQLPSSGLQAPVGAASVSLGLNFDGVSGDPGAPTSENCPAVSGFAAFPPDTNLAVGDTQVVQWVNVCYSIFDKSTGALIQGPLPGNHFWSGFGGPCETFNDGDPIIQWDKANHVWVAAQNVFHGSFGFFATCIAISTSSDATGSYHRYSFSQPAFPDYPKWGLTPNAYYQTQNMFNAFGGFIGVNVCGYDAAAMRKGVKNAKQVCILDSSNLTLFDDSLLPADSDQGSSSSPEVLLGSIDNPGFNSQVFEYTFTVNFHGAGSATLAGANGAMPIAVPNFTLGCGDCAAQAGTTTRLDSLGDRLMYRLARFDDGTTEHFLVTHSVRNTAALAQRWYEFTAPHGSTSLALSQTGETPDDGEFRWMGSIARDRFGNIALGYSRSSAKAGDFPSIYISGQKAGEPAGTTDLEVLAWAGNGSQTNTLGRWGDYSSMALDGADHCTFWYTNQYLPVTADFQWYTRLVQVKFPGCP
jgi:hypothetical protein